MKSESQSLLANEFRKHCLLCLSGVPPETTTWYMKLSWFMYSTTTTVVLLVGLTYWVVIYARK